MEKLYAGENNTCPICGEKIKHPYTGYVTIDKIEEDFRCCLWEEVIDEHGYTLGYKPLCKKEWRD